jgi:hypothetical protein
MNFSGTWERRERTDTDAAPDCAWQQIGKRRCLNEAEKAAIDHKPDITHLGKIFSLTKVLPSRKLGSGVLP